MPLAGDVLVFAYRGVVNGLYRIASLNDEGGTDWYYECEKPCIVIKRHIGSKVERLAYTPTSVIGAAFEDALNGRLEVAKERSSRVAVREADIAPENIQTNEGQ